MRNSRATIALAAVLSTSALGADGCALTEIGKPSPKPPGATPTPAKPPCLTDPPLGCAAFCAEVDFVDFLPACSSVDAGPEAQAFKTLINNKIATLLAQDQHACNPSSLGLLITPCQAGIAPVEWPGQDHEACTSVPLACVP